MEKLRRTPYRCRGCQNRFDVYVRRNSNHVEETLEAAETTETGHAVTEETRNPDVAKPAEP